MGPNEQWQSQVENELRNLKDFSVSQSISQLALANQQNYPLPSRIGQPLSNADNPFSSSDLIWIRVTAKQTVNGQIFYSWRRQIKLATANGYMWVDSGDSGTIDYRPATGVNNEDIPITDGKRYPAKWNPDTSQWIFFLRNYTPPPSSGTNYGVKTWVVWKDRSSLPAIANPLADDLAKQRVAGGGTVLYGTNGTVSDHGKVSAYTRLTYDRYDTFRIGQYTYAKPDSQSRSIPGIGAYDVGTSKSYFLYADSSILSNSYGITTYTPSATNGSLVLSDVKFHFDDSHGTSVYSNIATGDICFEWPYFPSAVNVQIRMTTDSPFPGRPTSWPSGYNPFTVSELQSVWTDLQTWRNCSLDTLYAGNPMYLGTYTGDGSNVWADIAWKMDLWKISIVKSISGKGNLYAQVNCIPGPRSSGGWTFSGDYFPNGTSSSGYMKSGLGLTPYPYIGPYALTVYSQFYGNIYLQNTGVGMELQWGSATSSGGATGSV